MKILIPLIIAFFMTGCNPFANYRPTSDDIVKKGWAKTHKKMPPKSIYCYKTIGDAMCYQQPLNGDQTHLQGSYDVFDQTIDEYPTQEP